MTNIGAGIADAFGGIPVREEAREASPPPPPSAPSPVVVIVPPASQAPAAPVVLATAPVPPAPAAPSEFPPCPVRQAIDVPLCEAQRKVAATSHALANAAQILGLDREALREAVSQVVGRPITGARDLTPEECNLALYAIRGRLALRRAILEDHEGRRRIIAAIAEAARAAGVEDTLEGAREKFGRPDLRYLVDLTNDERNQYLWHLREVAKNRKGDAR
jgi:hypothetical protein